MKVKLKDGREVEFRQPEEKDAEKLQKFINALVEEETFILMNEKMSLEKERKWLKEELKKIENEDVIMILAEVEGKIVGNCDIERKRGRSSHVGNFGITVAKTWRDAGLGTELMKAVLEKAKEMFEIIEINVFANNKRARHLYKKMGFKEEAVLPRRIKMKGEYVDSVVMSREP